MSKRDNAAPC